MNQPKNSTTTCLYIAGHVSIMSFIALLKQRTSIALQLLKISHTPASVFFAEVPYLFTTIYLIDNQQHHLSPTRDTPPVVGVLICVGEGAHETAQMIKQKMHPVDQLTIDPCPPAIHSRALRFLTKTLTNA